MDTISGTSISIVALRSATRVCLWTCSHFSGLCRSVTSSPWVSAGPCRTVRFKVFKVMKVTGTRKWLVSKAPRGYWLTPQNTGQLPRTRCNYFSNLQRLKKKKVERTMPRPETWWRKNGPLLETARAGLCLDNMVLMWVSGMNRLKCS